MSVSGSQGWDEKLKKLDKTTAKVGQHFDLGASKDGRKATAEYMGGSRWRIHVERALKAEKKA